MATAAPPVARCGCCFVKSHQKISDTEGGFTGTLDDGDEFGRSAASLSDLDGDGVTDLAVGAINDDDGGNPPNANRGAVWVLFLNTDGTVKSHQKISDTEGGFTGTLDDHDWFGASVASLGDLDGDGVGDLAVGADGDDDGGTTRGAVWVLFLDGVPACDGDMDGDGDVDLLDFELFLGCFTGPGGGPPALGCDCGDFDFDDHIDLRDFAGFQLAFTGSPP
jgi:hypothetical protein